MLFFNGFRKQKDEYQNQIDKLQKDIKTMTDSDLINLDKKFTEAEDFHDRNSYIDHMHQIIETEMEIRKLQTESELRENIWFSQRG